MKKFIFAPDSYKGTVSASEICSIWETEAHKFMPDAQCISMPVADGGEGLVDALHRVLGGQIVQAPAVDPLNREMTGRYLILPDETAVVEMAAVSGLPLLKKTERNPLKTTTYGTGMLIKDALDKGVKKLILGIGGSATNDGGVGAGAALGLQFLKADGTSIDLNGGGLSDLASIDDSGFDKRLAQIPVTIACDVDNPLCGPRGSSAIYGPQKGATPEMVAALDQNLGKLEKVILDKTGIQVGTIVGSGAAGGLSVPFIAFAGAELKSGIDIVLDCMGFDAALEGCDFVLTGEGKTDKQSAMGKAISGITKRAAAKNVPVVVISGTLLPDADALYDIGVTAMFSTCHKTMTLEEALSNSREDLIRESSNVFRLIASK